MYGRNLTPQEQAFADCWLKYGGQVRATAKALTTAQSGKTTPERVRQNIGRIARLGRLPSPDQQRVAIAKVLAKCKGDSDRLSPETLAAAEKLGMDVQCFQSSWPARIEATKIPQPHWQLTPASMPEGRAKLH
jgi:hypothetical protein